ncbi:MAG: preprotein translocase subunit SecE [Minisyncoccia bacterium]
MFLKLQKFLQESKQELKRVNWPTKDETIRYTLFVIVLSILIAVYLGLLDFVFLKILQKVLNV